MKQGLVIHKHAKSNEKFQWVKTRVRNEALDLWVYNLAALAILAPAWDRLEKNLKAKVAGKKPPPAAPRAGRRPGGYIRNW